MRNPRTDRVLMSGPLAVMTDPAKRLPAMAWVMAAIVFAQAVGLARARPATPPQKAPGTSTACPSLIPNPAAKLAHGTLSAKIDGVAWTAACVTVNTLAAVGIIGLGGSDNLPTPTGVGFGFGPSNKVGTYPVSNLSLGINGLLTVGPAAWQAAGATGGTGTLTFTQSTGSHVVGTFNFTLKAGTIAGLARNSATGTRIITDGVFDINF